MQNEQQDVYGFPLEGLSAQQRADRATCAAYEAHRKSKWQVFVDRQELPTGAVLKRYCRKVCTALQLLPVAGSSTACFGQEAAVGLALRLAMQHWMTASSTDVSVKQHHMQAAAAFDVWAVG